MAKSIYKLRVFVGIDEFHERAWRTEILTRLSKEEKRYNKWISKGFDKADVNDWIPWELSTKSNVADWDYFDLDGSTGIFSPRAIEVLKPYFYANYKLLPVSLNGETFYALHIHETFDCLDFKNSEKTYLPPPDEDLMLEIDKFSFHLDLIKNPLIFSIPEYRLQLFVTEQIPEIVEKAGLKGFEFKLLDGEV